ncbi:MAG: hypothetical protein HY231_23820 [Acidobacteria bacterium]|nr:hypothetical protein [Acidobacteriota bacterium]
MAKPVTKKLVTVIFLGVARTIEKFTQPEKKRLESAKPVVFGDGLNKVHYMHDPAFGCEPVTVTMIAKDDDPFVQLAEAARQRHKDDPTTAESAIVRVHADNGNVIKTFTLFRCVIQSLKVTDGDTASHDHAMMELILQPEDFQVG